METININSLSVSKHLISKIEIIESTLHQAIYNFRDFVSEIDQMHVTTESVKKQVIAQREKCQSKCCEGSEELKKVIASKENIIQGVVLALTKLNDTKNWSILTEVFSILFGESTLLDDKVKEEKILGDIKSDIDLRAMSLISPKKELEDNNNMSIEEEVSICEIDGTPTGRHSPIIQSKKLRSSTNNGTPPSRDKKKCPQNWMTPDKKSMKVTLTFPSPTRSKTSGRLRQQRISFVREKPSNTVDLTTTPHFSKGRNSQEECVNNIKQEVIENDDTIMPSPTSGPAFPPVYKSLCKESPQKFKKPLSLIRSKVQKKMPTDSKENLPLDDDVTGVPEIEASVDLLKDYNGFTSPTKCKPPKKSPVQEDNSMSLLQQFKDVEKEAAVLNNSPVKRPLADNLNVMNTACDIDASMSILRRDPVLKMGPLDEHIERTKNLLQEPLYKEPTARKKAEKRALPGWSCEECKHFFELYADNPEMLAKKMNYCSKHRGRNNPARPKTPPGFWDPRWDVPEDTEEFNKRNNAV